MPVTIWIYKHKMHHGSNMVTESPDSANGVGGYKGRGRVLVRGFENSRGAALIHTPIDTDLSNITESNHEQVQSESYSYIFNVPYLHKSVLKMVLQISHSKVPVCYRANHYII